jgi:hypothetical protein
VFRLPECHGHALCGQRVGAALLVNDVRRNWADSDNFSFFALLFYEVDFICTNILNYFFNVKNLPIEIICFC